MPNSVEGVVGEWKRKEGLAGILEAVGNTTKELDDVSRFQGPWCDEISEEVTVEDCRKRLGSVN